MEYVIAIPSHRRSMTFAKRTLKYLQSTNIDLDRVTLFLSDDEDFDAYEMWGLNMVVTNVKNARDKFNAIHYHYPVGTRVFVIEDDIHNLCYRDDHATPKRQRLVDLDGMIQESFEELGEKGMWGINPSDNTHYTVMWTAESHLKPSGRKYQFTRKLNLLVAHAFGFVSTRDPELAVKELTKTDYERSCLYFEKSVILRRFDIGAGTGTNSYNNEGGMQEDHTRDERREMEDKACDNLVARFPELLDHNFFKESSPFAELRMRYR